MAGHTDNTSEQAVQRRDVLRAAGSAASVGIATAAGSGVTRASQENYTFLTQNAWMLDELYAGFVPGQPDAADFDWLPRDNSVKPVEKPALEERAQALGARLSYSDIDIAGLQEVFDQEQRTQIRKPVRRQIGEDLDDAIGPRQRLEEVSVSGGLYTLALGHDITITERMAFESRGNRRRDADAYARKGVLFTRVNLGDGAVDIFTTHLLAGGGWPGEPVDPRPVREPTSPTEFRRRQLDEFEAFVKTVKSEHDPDGQVPTVCAGDFNIAPGDPEAGDLDLFKENLGLVDAWKQEHPNRPGATDSDAITDACMFDPSDSPPSYCDGGASEEAGRIDYVFVEDRPDFCVDRIRRRVFWRELAPPSQFFADQDEEQPNYLADHVGLELDFSLASAA